MKFSIFIGLFLLSMVLITSCSKQNSPISSVTPYEDYPSYEEDDLGLTRPSNDFWQLKIWAPTAEFVEVKFYESGMGGKAYQVSSMNRQNNGIWTLQFPYEDYLQKFYTFRVKISGKWKDETVDPYVKLVGVNGKRGFIDLPSKADPENWATDQSPALKSFQDIIIYELQIRDFSRHASSGINNKGKYLAFTETETTNSFGVSTGVAHLKDLGITHVHMMPAFDFRSIDETKNPAEYNYNWGYDPQNYNVPEGSFSSDPYDPLVRVKEFKQMVQSLHQAGIRVVLDVVYNHTGYTEQSVFNQLVPGYYYRHNQDGTFSDAAACGNETASERPMMRKFMIESRKYWVEEYHIDGFRVDLMGIHDIETMDQISRELHELDPTIFIYGEGWTAGPSPLPDSLRALKANAYQLDSIAVFSDELRDGIKGHWAKKKDKGFVSAKENTEESVKFGIVAGTQHPDVSYEAVNYVDTPWAMHPFQCINYVSCHDDLTLWDKLKISVPGADQEELIDMHLLANTIVMTSQGIPFLHGGVDFLRTKNGDHNSYESPDSINSLNWSRKATFEQVHQYYKNLIQLRKDHPAFKMGDRELIVENLQFLTPDESLMIGYKLNGKAVEDRWSSILVYFNGAREDRTIALPGGEWKTALSGRDWFTENPTIVRGDVKLNAISALILYQE
jgi:pullulanase